MNQTSLVGRPLHSLTKAVVAFAEKRGVWSGPLTSSSPELARLWGAPPTSTGMGVDETSAFTYSVFWACVNNISTDTAALPLLLYKRLPNGGKEPMRDHKLFSLLHDAPNPEMTAFTFRGLLTSNALTYGMGYAEIVRDGAGRVAELWPITPNRVQVKRESRPPYRIYYEVSREDSYIDRLSSEQMFVLPGSTIDGVYGRNIVNMARESIGLGLAAERFGGTFYGNGSTFGGVFEHPGRMSEQALKNFRDSVNTQHQGVDKAHKFIVVEEAMKFQRLSVDQNAAQFIETRQHQVEETCRWFRMPPHKIQHLIRTSYNSVEHLDIEYATDTLQPRCVSWEQELWRQLIAPPERRIQFFKHNMDGRLRGDTTARGTFYQIMRNIGAYSADDVREKEDMNPLPDGQGKVYLVPMNMSPADRVNEIIDKQVAPDPKPVAPAPAAKEDADRQVLEALQRAIEESEARAASTAAQIARLEDANRGLTERTGEQDEAETALRSQLATEQSTVVVLKAQVVDATERMARVAAEQEAERLAAEDLRAQVEAAHAGTEAAKAVWAEEAAKAAQLQALVEAERAAKEQAVADAVKAAEDLTALLAERDGLKAHIDTLLPLGPALDAKAAEHAAVVAQLEAEQARAAQAERDRAVMAQTAAAADLALTDLRAQLQAADQLLAETSSNVLTERSAMDAARAQVAQLEATIAETQAEITRLAAERAEQALEATTAAQAAEEAHRATVAATAQLAQATADAEAARQQLAAETARVETERAAKAAVEAQAQAQRQAHADRLQAILPAQRDLAIDLMGRLVRVEADRARRNQGTPSKLKAWAEAFYLQQEDRYLDALRPFMRAHLVFIGSTEDVDVYARKLIAPQLTEAVRQIRIVADGDPEDFAVSLERLLTKWEQERPVALADRVFHEEMTYVRSL